MSGAATAGDGGDSDDGEATTPISSKMSPIAPTTCHARTFHNMELCDEMLCDERQHRWTLIRSLTRRMVCCSAAAPFTLTGAVADLLSWLAL